MKNYYSQNGEDAIISHLLNKLNLKPENMYVIDIGAYEGYSYSNVIRLIEQGSAGLLIEPAEYGGICEDKFSMLKRLPEKFNKIAVKKSTIIPKNLTDEQKESVNRTIHHMESQCGVELPINIEQQTIEEIFDEFNVPLEFDILNIDTDSFDHEIWYDLKKYRPKIVIIETESTFRGKYVPPLHELENLSPFNEIKFGLWSKESSNWLADKKGYTEHAFVGNCIYVRTDLL